MNVLPASSWSAVLFALALSPLAADPDRPVDDPFKLPPAGKPTGTLLDPDDPIDAALERLLPKLEPVAPGRGFRAPQLDLAPWAADAAAEKKRWMIGVVFAPQAADGEGPLTVARAMEGSPAAKAGLAKGDVIVGVNGIRIRDMAMLRDLIQLVESQEIELTLKRGDGERKVKMTSVEMEMIRGGEDAPQPPQPAPTAGGRVVPRPNPPAPAAAEMIAQLRRDNADLKNLLRELIGEVKKLQPAGKKPARVRRVPTPPASSPGER